MCNQQPSGEGMTGAQVGSRGLTSSMWTMASVGCGMKASDQSQASVWSTSTSPDTMRSFMRPTQGSVPQEGRASTSGCLRWRDTEGRHGGGPRVLSTFQASPGGRLKSSRGRQEAPGSTTGHVFNNTRLGRGWAWDPGSLAFRVHGDNGSPVQTLPGPPAQETRSFGQQEPCSLFC